MTGKAHDRIMQNRPACRVAHDGIIDIHEFCEIGGDASFFAEFALRRLAHGLAEFETSTGQAPFAFPRLLAAFDQQNLTVAPDAGTDPDSRNGLLIAHY